MTDLKNNEAPLNSSPVTISVKAFKRWMSECGFTQASLDNPGQEVFFIHQGESFTDGSHNVTPNWHITAMTVHRGGGDCDNFHFKLEIGKAASHYWHYVVHRDNTGKYHWVGHPNPQNHTTNEGGGKAAGDMKKLMENRTLTEMEGRKRGITDKLKQKDQKKMLQKLERLIAESQLRYANNRVEG